MIVGSLALILAAVAMLGLGLVRGSNAFLIGSIAASLLAAIALIVGARRAADLRAAAAGRVPGGADETGLADTLAGQDDARVARNGSGPPRQAAGRGSGAAGPGGESWDGETRTGTVGGTETLLDDDATRASIPTQSRAGRETPGYPGDRRTDGRWAGDPTASDPNATEEYADEDPPDEPAPERVSAADAARVARMSAAVMVVDGRPRYHRANCVHLLGRESELLPVSEALDLGFSPCGICEPDRALLAEARRP